LPIFGEKIGGFHKYQCYDHNFLQKLAVVWAKNANIFAKCLVENILKIITSVPGWVCKKISQIVDKFFSVVKEHQKGTQIRVETCCANNV
jgi:hypothetical protein